MRAAAAGALSPAKIAHPHSIRRFAALLTAASLLVAANDAPAPSGEPDLAEVRSATERFRDVKVALAEGYIRDPMNICETADLLGQPAEFGAMGVHYFRPDLLGITAPPNPRVNGNGTHTDFRKPAILIYEPQADGSLELVAVENLVFRGAWEALGHMAPPTYQGLVYDTMADDPATSLDEAHMFEPHYDRHVWLYRDNPNGVFAPFNPKVTCKHHRSGTVAGR
ncbi:hypothetical protein [Sphingosinicella humi]|uniref:hypothetical protein n=1 Tax=Allosphingosinicella humi TaxID=2068657 RepID=UPI001A9C3BC3|nr:hypothetical protein [Sphingosinicella humi]